MIYIWVYYIKIYDPIKFLSNLRVCLGAINTCSHYERQVTSDRKNERNVSSYIIYIVYIYSLLVTLYIFIIRLILSLSFSHPFRPSSEIRIIIIIIFLSLSLLILSFVFYSSHFYWNEDASVAWRRTLSRLRYSDKNEAISVFSVVFMCIYS